MLHKRGFPQIGGSTMYRQVNLDSYGIADLIAIEPPYKHNDSGNVDVCVKVFELKKDECDVNTMRQLSTYMAAIKHIVEDHINEILPSVGNCGINLHVYGYMVGKSYKSDIIYILENIQNISMVTYDFSLRDGLTFNDIGKGWRRSNFNLNKTDISKIRLIDLFRNFDEYYTPSEILAAKKLQKNIP